METKQVKKSRLDRKTRAIMALIGGALVLMCTGGGIYGASNMTVVPMAEKFGVTTAETQLYYSWWLAGLIIAGFVGPAIVNKLNLQGSAIVGGIIGAAGLLLMGLGNSIYIYYFGAFLTGWPICLTGPALLQTAVSKWFYTGRATILGLVGLSEAIGTTVIANITAALTESAGGLTSALIVSAAFVLFGNLIAGLFFFKGIPEDYGWVAIGSENLVKKDESGAENMSGLTRAQAFKLPYFWTFLIGMSILNFAYGMVQPNLSAYTQFVGFSAAQAAIIVSVWSWGKSISKILYGFLCDTLGVGIGLAIATCVSIVTGILYTNAHSFGMLIVCAAGIGVIGGLTGAGTMGMSRLVGQRDLMKMALLPHAFNGIGNFFAPMLFAALFTGDAAGYRLCGWISVVVLAVYAVMMLWSLQNKHLVESGNSFKKAKAK